MEKWSYMLFLKNKNHSPIKNIHGSLAEILEITRLILAITNTPDRERISHFWYIALLKLKERKGAGEEKGERKERRKKEMIWRPKNYRDSLFLFGLCTYKL